MGRWGLLAFLEDKFIHSKLYDGKIGVEFSALIFGLVFIHLCW